MKMFGERFIASRGEPIDVDGRLVHSIYRRRVSPGESFELAWIAARHAPVQGIRLKLEKGHLKTAGQRIKDLVLWRDTAPDIDILTSDCRADTELRVWNCWRDSNGTMQAWIGNGGMLIEPLGDRDERVRFHCNSRHEVTFEDLVFELRFTEQRRT